MPDKPLEIKPNFVDGTIEITKSIDCAPMIKLNNEEAIAGPNRSKEGVMGRKIASVPTDVLQAWKVDYGVDYTQINHDPDQRVRFYRLLKEYKKFLTYHGGLRH